VGFTLDVMATHEHDLGLGHDLNTLLARRRALQLFAGLGLAAVAGCADETTSTGDTPSSTATSSGTTAGCEQIPAETAGPYPGDGSNGPDVLTESGIVRQDITKSFGSSSGTATGVPLTIELTVTDSTNGCAALAGAAVYLWHCDSQGRYSLYSDGATEENYLRGVQAAGADGRVTFRSIFPAAYSGRWPHIHFEVYDDLATATRSGDIRSTSQLALPEQVCGTVYNTDGYDGSLRNMEQTSLESDNVFRDDGGVRQLATVTGSVSEGYVAKLTIAV
jgi:protocatechuate 3,4-dioxygenase beta subunit